MSCFGRSETKKATGGDPVALFSTTARVRTPVLDLQSRRSQAPTHVEPPGHPRSGSHRADFTQMGIPISRFESYGQRAAGVSRAVVISRKPFLIHCCGNHQLRRLGRMRALSLQRVMLQPPFARKAYNTSGGRSSEWNRPGTSWAGDALEVPHES